VPDSEGAYRAAVKRGAKSLKEPKTVCDDKGKITRAEVMAFDGFSHVFLERSSDERALLPAFERSPSSPPPKPIIKDWITSLSQLNVALWTRGWDFTRKYLGSKSHTARM